MKLKNIRIRGMHNVVDRTYDLNDTFTYFVGPNGAGKSTILEAIQLVILGYIPGYPKTNEGIMRHSSGDELEVIGTFDNGVVVSRKWTRTGTSVSNKVTTVPDGMLKDEGIVDDKLELPIYNFNEFKDMTANKLKEWFISFLPSSENAIDWEVKLKDVLKERGAILTDEFYNETLEVIHNLAKDLSGVELVKKVNEYLKNNQSFTKKEIERLQGTIQSLVHYEEELPAQEDVNAQLTTYIDLLSQLSVYEASQTNYNSVKAQIDSLDVDKSPEISSVEDVESYIELRNRDANITSQFNQVSQERAELLNELSAIETEITQLASISNSTCPYTKKECNEIAAIVNENTAKIAELKKKCRPIEDAITEKASLQSKLDHEMFEIRTNLQKMETDYITYFRLRDILNTITSGVKPTEMTKEEINAKISNLQQSLSKIEANKRYDELTETITTDKFNLENNLEVLKVWIKLTDANGLQTELMTKPFLGLADEMTKYLVKMFKNYPVSAQFNLSSKANSFSFGLQHEDGKYVEFDCLSAGERCLFMLALMICLVNKSDPEFKTILIDDLVDHLDDVNAASVFASLSNIDDIQFVIAGVKEAEGEGIVKIQM